MKRRFRLGFTLLELLVSVTVLTIACSLLLPVIARYARESSRKQSCSDNMREIGLALLQYEQTHKRLVGYNCTWGYGGYNSIPYWSIAPGYSGAGRWSGFIALLPYMNQGPLESAFHKGNTGRTGSATKTWGPYGSIVSSSQVMTIGTTADVTRYPWSCEYEPNRRHLAAFHCPADPFTMRSAPAWSVARTNYAFCLGDGQVGIHGGDTVVDTVRGAFQSNMHHTLAAITDGASMTLAFGEIATPETCSFGAYNQGTREVDAKVQGRAIYELASQSDLKGINVKDCRAFVDKGHYLGAKRNWSNLGLRNFDALASYTGFNTVNAPNGGSCTPTDDPWGEGEGIYTASSYHLGGAHAVTFDGRVLFINDGISTYDNRVGMLDKDYYSPARQWVSDQWEQTPNWTAESPFGVWGAMGTRSGNEYPNTRPIE